MLRAVSLIGLALLCLGIIVSLAWRTLPSSEDRDALAQAGFFQFDSPVTVAVDATDAFGEPMLQRLRGHWAIVFFGFTRCPDVCPTTLSVLNLAVEPLANPPLVALMNLDERDTTETVSQYVTAFNRSFLAFGGDREVIEQTANTFGIRFEVVQADDGSTTLVHSGLLVVLDPTGRHVGYLRPPFHAEKLRPVIESVMLQTLPGSN